LSRSVDGTDICPRWGTNATTTARGPGRARRQWRRVLAVLLVLVVVLLAGLAWSILEASR
jgi:hypothetical protein